MLTDDRRCCGRCTFFFLCYITNHLMTGPSGNSSFCFRRISMLPSAAPRGNIEILGKQNELYPSGPVINCLIKHGNTGTGGRFSKVPKLYGPFSGVTIPFVSQERRGFNSSNFTVIFLFVTLKTC